MIGDSERDLSNQVQYLHQFQQIQIAGLLITPVRPEIEMLQAIRDAGTPVVVIARRWEEGDEDVLEEGAGKRVQRVGLMTPQKVIPDGIVRYDEQLLILDMNK